MSHPKRAITAVTVATAAALVLAGCTSSGESGGNDAAERDMNVQLYQQPDGFNTLKAAIGGDQLIQSLHFDTLIGWSEDEGEYESRLAESWTVSDDAQSVSFDLVPGLSWSDGEPFTADDVVFTYNLMANPDVASATAGLLANVVGYDEVADGSADTISGIVADDEDTVTFSLASPDSSFIANFIPGNNNFGFILPEHALAETDPAGLADSEWFREPTAGMGPYVFSKWINDAQIEFVANPEFRSELGLDRVLASVLTTDVATAQLQTGELNLTNVSAVDFETVEAIDGVEAVSVPGAGVLALHSAMDTFPELADPRVRQAMMYAIDRQSIIDEVFHGQGTVVNTLVHGPEWAVPSDLETYDYNPEKAKELLAEAGWDPAREVTIEIVPGTKDRDLTIDIVAAQLQDVGINAVVRQLDAAGQTASVTDRDFQLLISGFGNFVIDPAAMDVRLMCEASGNIQKFCNPALDELLMQGIATSDPAEREQIYAEAQHLVNADVPMIILSSPNVIYGVGDTVEGFEPRRLLTDMFYSAPDWSLAD